MSHRNPWGDHGGSPLRLGGAVVEVGFGADVGQFGVGIGAAPAAGRFTGGGVAWAVPSMARRCCGIRGVTPP